MAPEESRNQTGRNQTHKSNVIRVLKIQLPVSVLMAEKQVPLEYVMNLGPGRVVEFEKPCDELLDILVAGKKIGSGEVVKVGERFGIVVREIGGVRERVEQLGSFGPPPET